MRKEINEVIKKWGVSPEDVFISDVTGYKIIRRPGIMHIRYKMALSIELTLEHVGAKEAVVKAKALDKDGIPMSTYGEANPDNNTFPYPVAVAQKRAESRLVIQMSNLIKDGWMGEDEVDFRVKEEAKIKVNEKKAKDSIEETKRKLGI